MVGGLARRTHDIRRRYRAARTPIERVNCRTPPAAPCRVPSHIERNAIDPRGESATLSITTARIEQTQEHLLTQVLHRSRGPREMGQKSRHGSLPARNE